MSDIEVSVPFPGRAMHTDECPGCKHPLGVHAAELGCTDGWSYYGPYSPLAGLSKAEGCECPLTLAGQHFPPTEGDLS